MSFFQCFEVMGVVSTTAVIPSIDADVMLNIQPEPENITKHEVSLSEPETTSDLIHEVASGTFKQVSNNSKHTLHPPSQLPSKENSSSSPSSGTTTNFSKKAPAEALETSSKAMHNDTFESDDVSRSSENTSTRISPSEEIANTAKSKLEIPSQRTCRDRSSLSSVSDEETSGLPENCSNRFIPSREISDITKNTLESPSQRTCKDGSILSLDSGGESSSMSLSVIPSEEVANISKSTLQISTPMCRDDLSLSSYSDDKTTNMSETALATIGYASEVRSSSSESEVEEDNVISQLPRNLVAQTPQVSVDNSSDVHIGPHVHYTGPITVNQYITLNGREAIESDNSSSDVPAQVPELKEIMNVKLKHQGKDGNKSDSSFSEVIMDVSQMNSMDNFVINENYSPELPKNGVNTDNIHIPEDGLLCGSEDTLLNIKKKFKKMRYISISFIVFVVLCISVALSLMLPVPEKEKSPECSEHIVACYVASWAHLRQSSGMFTVDDIDPSQCTHLLYAFAHLSTTTNTIFPANPVHDLGNEQEIGAYEKMTSLKKKYPHLKVLISMGGWAERVNKNYTHVAEVPSRRKEFIASVVDFISKYDFDGLDVHWQYPTELSGTPADKQLFVFLLKELREEFDKQGKNWILTAPVGVMPITIKRSYNIPEVNKYLHYMFALCYAYHGFWEFHTGPNAPLYRSRAGDELNVEASIRKLLKLGAQPEKLVLGLALNGRSFNLADEKDSEKFGGRTVGEGFTGPYVGETASWGYNEICTELVAKHSNWVVHWDDVSHTPFMTNKIRFISYDNERSLTEKVNFALKKKLAGVVTYSLDTDDFRGECASDSSKENNYPLMRAINKAFCTAS